MSQVTLNSSKFEEFLRCLLLLKDICNDADIRNGFVRQRTNDSATVFEIDLTAIIENMSLPITELKTKIDMFKCFVGQEVTIETTNSDFIISDQYSSLKIKNTILDFMDNKFISQEELDRVIITNAEDIVFSTEISKIISDRMKVISGGLHVNTIQVIIETDKASITATNQSKENHAKFISNIICEKEFNHSANLVLTPFVIDHDGNITFKMYNSQDEVVINTFKTTIGDIPVNLYTRASLVSLVEE